MRTSLLALPLVALLGGAAALPDPQPIDGWWVARLEHQGEQRDFYLNFVDRNGALHARFSIPEIGADNSPLGPAKVGATAVELPAIGWTLQREDGGSVLVGTIPHDLVPHYTLTGRFVRAGSPPPADDMPAASAAPPDPAWQASVEGPVYAGLAVNARRGEVLVGSTTGRLTALAARDGAARWSVDLGAPIRATPLVSGNAIYVPTDAALFKLDARNGKRLWNVEFGAPKAKFLDPATDQAARWDVYSSSAIEAEGLVVAGSRDGCVYILRARDGGRQAKACSGDIVTSTPLVRGGQVYFGSFDGKVYAASLKDGTIRWQRDTHGAVSGDLALASGRILAGSRSYDLAALDPVTGTPAWTRYFWFSWVESSPTVETGRVYIGSSDSRRVFAFAAATGASIWSARVPGWTWPRPAVGRATIYAGVVGTERPYVGKRRGGLAALDKATGRLKWLVASPAPKDAMFYGFAAAPVVAGGTVYAADLSGRVIALPDR
ncbi:MAG TPA: PQQ-binding-like beta-propeller repeat protein [Sphingomicrobium sp.]